MMSNKYLEKIASAVGETPFKMYDAPKLPKFGKAPKILAGALGAVAGIGAGQALRKSVQDKNKIEA